MKLRSPVTRDEGVFILKKFRDKVREQAMNHALTLTFMSIMFVITWAVIIFSNLWAVAHGK